MTILDDRTIALAAVLQIAEQVQNLARTGTADEAAVRTAIRSVLVLDAASTPAVFGGLQEVRNGLQLLANGVLASPSGDDIELLRYTMSLLTLQTQLMRDGERFAEFGAAIERLSAIDADKLPDRCSEIYQQFVSPLQPQIIVQGEQDFLQRDDIPVKIRSLLLAGIRAAVLWQQKRGSRFRLLWERTRMRNAAQLMLQQITH